MADFYKIMSIFASKIAINMKTLRNIIVAAMLLLVTSAMADNFAYLTIGQDGGETSVSVSQISKITFDASNLVIHLTDGNTQELPLSSLSKMFFTASDQGLATITASKDKISIDGSTLRLQLADGEHAAIFDMNGVQVYTANESVEVNTGSLRRGVYIVRVGSQTKKIMTR